MLHCAFASEGGVRRIYPLAAKVRATEHGAFTLWSKDRQMISVRNPGSSVPSASSPLRPEPHAWARSRLLGWMFPQNAVTDVVATSLCLRTSPETLWQRMLMYEDVPGRPPLLLRVLLPVPVRTEGDKTRVGAILQCTYKGGHLVKRIKAVEPPHLLRFEVIEQRLGIERCITTLGGLYQIRSRGGQTEIVLTTNYRGHLGPRFFWRLVERFLVHQLHRHILNGMRASLSPRGSSARHTVKKSSLLKSIPPQDLACTISPSHSRP
jgi:hypothetical protein